MSAMENSDQLWEVEAAPDAVAMPAMAERYLAPTALFLIPILGFFLWVAESMVVNAAR